MISETALPVLHRSVKGAPQPAEELAIQGNILFHPKDIIDYNVGNWHRLCCSRPLDHDKLHRTFDSIRGAAEVEALPLLPGEEVQAAARQMRPRAGQGADRISPLDVE
eukprot:5267480-Pyramimonas_sp.AAC.1